MGVRHVPLRTIRLPAPVEGSARTAPRMVPGHLATCSCSAVGGMRRTTVTNHRRAEGNLPPEGGLSGQDPYALTPSGDLLGESPHWEAHWEIIRPPHCPSRRWERSLPAPGRRAEISRDRSGRRTSWRARPLGHRPGRHLGRHIPERPTAPLPTGCTTPQGSSTTSAGPVSPSTRVPSSSSWTGSRTGSPAGMQRAVRPWDGAGAG